MLTLIEPERQGYDTGISKNDILKCIEDKKRCFLILPEQLTVTVEKELCRFLPASFPLFLEISNFTRFTNTVFRNIGGVAKEYCTPAKKTLVMWRALSELSPILNLTSGSKEVKAGHVKKALEAVFQMQNLGISPNMLSDTLKNTNFLGPRLLAKLNDLSLIYTLYRRLLTEKYADSHDDLEILAKKLDEDSGVISGSVIFIDGFTSFTEPQYHLISRLMRYSDLRVRLPLPKLQKNSFEYTEIKNTEQRLLLLANKIGCNKKLEFEQMPNSDQNLISKVTQLLWEANGSLDENDIEKIESKSSGISLFVADTPFEECDFIAQDIKRRIIEGAKYNDIAVIARCTDDYLGILDASLKRADIPHFISKKSDINSYEAIKLIITAYSVIKRNFRREDLLTYVKCGILGIERNERDAFELYLEKWNIDSQRFTDGILWNMNPRGYEVLTEEDIEALKEINKTREKIIAPLVELSEGVKEAKTVRDMAVALFDFLGAVKLEEKLIERSKLLFELSEYAAAEENARLFSVICDSLDDLVEVLGDFDTDAESFISQLSTIFNEIGIARIPSRQDEVTVGSADMLRLKNKRYVYLIGVNRGKFPKTVSDNSYFSDAEKSMLNLVGLPIDKELEIKNAKELYYFSRAMCSAKDEIVISYSLRNASFAEDGPSVAIDALIEVTKNKIKPRLISELPIREYLYSSNGALQLKSKSDAYYAEVKQALIKAGCDSKFGFSEEDVENANLKLHEETLGVIYKGDLYLSQTKIDSFLRCPMNYFCRYNLRLDTLENAELNNRIIGTFIHSILENFFSEMSKLGKSASEITEQEKKALTTMAAQSYIKEVLGNALSSARGNIAVKRLCRAAEPVIDSLCDEFKNCKFTPLLFEVNINDRDLSNPSPIKITAEDGTRIIIGGQIDRVDTYQAEDKLYVRVVDYKSGGKNFSPSDIAEGRNLQMFLYLKSIVETDRDEFRLRIGAAPLQKIVPAGVIYVKTSVKDVKIKSYNDIDGLNSVKNNQERLGMLLMDDTSISAMNPDFLPFDVTNNKNLNKFFTEEGWKKINEDIEKAVLKITSDIKSGCISASPNVKDHPCESCKFKPFCRSV